LGETAFAAIAAVEGLILSKADRRWIDDLRHKDMSSEAIRAEIVRYFPARAAA
jgi:hypothetical protein